MMYQEDFTSWSLVEPIAKNIYLSSRVFDCTQRNISRTRKIYPLVFLWSYESIWEQRSLRILPSLASTESLIWLLERAKRPITYSSSSTPPVMSFLQTTATRYWACYAHINLRKTRGLPSARSIRSPTRLTSRLTLSILTQNKLGSSSSLKAMLKLNRQRHLKSKKQPLEVSSRRERKVARIKTAERETTTNKLSKRKLKKWLLRACWPK